MCNSVMMQLGERQITDGTTRPVFRSDDGGRFVIDDADEPVYGTWLYPDEYIEPFVYDLPAGFAQVDFEKSAFGY
jgi:hypothetical protein